jgi:hypothetical protein
LYNLICSNKNKSSSCAKRRSWTIIKKKKEVGQKYNYTLTRQLLDILREFSLEEDITSSLSNGKSSLLWFKISLEFKL